MHFDYAQYKLPSEDCNLIDYRQKGFAPIIILVGILVLASAGGVYYFFKVKTPIQKACTMDAKICPDGSSVGRVGPNCEFAPCPKFSPSPSPVDASREPTGSAETVYTEAIRSANWKIYTDPKQTFSIKYPGEFDPREGIDWNTGILFFSGNIRIRNTSSSVFECKTDCPDFSSVDDIVINSISVRKGEGIKNIASGNLTTNEKGPYLIYQFPKNGIYYLLEYKPVAGRQLSDQREVFHLMARTFKFLE